MKEMMKETLGEEGVKDPIIPKGETIKIDPPRRGGLRGQKKARKEQKMKFVMHRKGESRLRWIAWNPNVKAMMPQEVIYEDWEEGSTTLRANGMVQVTTANRRLEWELEQLHYQQPRKCFMERKALGVVATYAVDAELWQAWLAAHTEAKADES